MTLTELKQAIDEAQARYLEIVNTAPQADVLEAGRRVKALRADLVSLLTEGAKACPSCGAAPHGMEQPTGKGGTEYEIGCLACGPFVHKDGTVRQHRVRGGMLPKHAVDAWNAGPDFWMKKDDRVGYVVESPVTDAAGKVAGVARIYVATEERAKALAANHPQGLYSAIPYSLMPAVARENLETANSAAQA